MLCTIRASNGPDHLGLPALQLVPDCAHWTVGSAREDHSPAKVQAGGLGLKDATAKEEVVSARSSNVLPFLVLSLLSSA